jgi:hypothetical protein
MCRAFRAGFVIPLFNCLGLDSDENAAPKCVKLSRAGAPGAPQFGFDAFDRVLRPELRDAAPRRRIRGRA